MKNLVNSLSKYTGLSEEELTQAFEAMQDDRMQGLFDEIDNNNLVVCNCDLDCTPNTDNLKEWLSLYYTVDSK